MTILKVIKISTIKSIRNRKSYNNIRRNSNSNRQKKPLKRKTKNTINKYIYK